MSDTIVCQKKLCDTIKIDSTLYKLDYIQKTLQEWEQ